MSQVIFKALFFIIAFAVLLGVVGVSDQSNNFEFPEKPEIAGLGNIPILGAAVETAAFVVLAIGSVFNIVFITFTDIIPAWLNLIVFLPLGIFVIYEIAARLVRGS